ncbi:hypothetical protein EVAR_62513_1 [Eumeta japonica]|uniref:Uncharacterized protein n=1 Tax=Eumeta variegata TaxID=151549 RepID=A0A4C1SG92_EUMVA|nr:hypothetical protein EVAR_62513_1 [Eumeta japonica]
MPRRPLQETSRACHAPSALTRRPAVLAHTTHAYGREGGKTFYPPRRGKQKKIPFTFYNTNSYITARWSRSAYRSLVRLCVSGSSTIIMPPKTSGKAAKKSGKAQKNISKSDKKEEARGGELRHLHLQGAQAGPSGHRYI